MPNIPRIEVDFNDFDDDGRLGALVSSADDASSLQPGALVALWDEDGNTAQGRVSELRDRGLVLIDVLRPTWRTAADVATEHAIAADLADLTPPVGIFRVGPVIGLGAPFGVTATPAFYFGPTLVFLADVHGAGHFILRSSSRAAWPAHLDFAESYKLRSVAGTAPVTAELGS